MLKNMDTGCQLLMLGLIGLVVCLASAQTAAPETHVDVNNGVETSIPGTTIPRNTVLPTPPHQAQGVPSYVYNNGGNVVLQNEAGSIYTRPDGSKVLVGANGQTIVTNGDDSDEDSDNDDDDVGGGSGGNIVINGRNVGGHSFYSSNGGGGAVFSNYAGSDSYQVYNNHQIRLLNGGLELTTGGKVYNFPAKDASVQSKEKIDINGQQAVLQYDNGNIIIELADGTVLAKADGGLFSGNMQSYVNRKQIQEQAAQEALNAQKHVAQLQRQLNEQLGEQMRKLQEDLQRTLGNIRF